MVNSNDFDEFKARLSHFDKELINPERYVNVNDNKQIFKNIINAKGMLLILNILNILNI